MILYMNILLVLLFVFINYSFSFFSKNFLTRKTFRHLDLYKYEKEYYDFYIKYRNNLLSNSLKINHTAFVDKNYNNYVIFEKNLDYINDMNTNFLNSDEN